MLLELAIGDAYGAGFEYANRQLIQRQLKSFLEKTSLINWSDNG